MNELNKKLFAKATDTVFLLHRINTKPQTIEECKTLFIKAPEYTKRYADEIIELYEELVNLNTNTGASL